MANFDIGDVIEFSYESQVRKVTNDHAPQVLVLHPNWENQVHGLNLNYLSDSEINLLRAILNEEFADKYSDALGREDHNIGRELNRFSDVYDSLNITSPRDFYIRFVRRFIQPRGWDPYRRYLPQGMSNVRKVKTRQQMSSDTGESVMDKFFNRFRARRGSRIPKWRR